MRLPPPAPTPFPHGHCIGWPNGLDIRVPHTQITKICWPHALPSSLGGWVAPPQACTQEVAIFHTHPTNPPHDAQLVHTTWMTKSTSTHLPPCMHDVHDPIYLWVPTICPIMAVCDHTTPPSTGYRLLHQMMERISSLIPWNPRPRRNAPIDGPNRLHHNHSPIYHLSMTQPTLGYRSHALACSYGTAILDNLESIPELSRSISAAYQRKLGFRLRHLVGGLNRLQLTHRLVYNLHTTYSVLL